MNMYPSLGNENHIAYCWNCNHYVLPLMIFDAGETKMNKKKTGLLKKPWLYPAQDLVSQCDYK